MILALRENSMFDKNDALMILPAKSWSAYKIKCSIQMHMCTLDSRGKRGEGGDASESLSSKKRQKFVAESPPEHRVLQTTSPNAHWTV